MKKVKKLIALAACGIIVSNVIFTGCSDLRQEVKER